jgi:hypothetical protein
MSDSRLFDPASAHRFFSADCFNRTWDLLEKADHSAAEDEQMLLLCHASLWHWTQRTECTPRNLSIGYWQLSRVYAVLGQAENARRYAEISLQHSIAEPPFYRGYAHEALARAAKVAGDRGSMESHLAEAKWLLAEVGDAEERAALEKDLAELQ